MGAKRFALLTTWAARCGIAEYSRSLVEALAGHGVGVTVLAQRRPAICWPPFAPPPGCEAVREVWETGHIDPAAVVRACRAARLCALGVQYHHGFFEPEALLALAGQCTRAGLDVTVTLHNSR